MTKRVRFTMKDHVETAGSLNSIRQAVMNIHRRVSATYGKATGAGVMKIVRQIDQLRSELDDRLCREHPGDDSVVRVYYPSKVPAETRLQMTPEERQRELRALWIEVKAIRAMLERQRVRSILLQDEIDSEVPYGE